MPTVGFDLDMTLVDSRPGIAAVWREVSARTGVFVDAELAVSRLGPPIRREIANWFPDERVEEVLALYRELYREVAVAASPALPGAVEAVAAMRAAGVGVVVISAKIGYLVQYHLDHLGIQADVVAGDRFGAGKTAAINEHRVEAYVGDHVADMAAALAAGVPGVGVPTGPCDADALRAAGAAVVLPGLAALPSWWLRR